MDKCALFRTAEDYRDHLPCEVCEPTSKAAVTDEWRQAHTETFEVLWRTAKENVELRANLTAVHERCNQLLEEKHVLRRLLGKLNDAFVSSEPDKARVRREVMDALEKTT